MQADLPAVCIGGSLKEGFDALIPGRHWFRYTVADRKDKDAWEQVVPMKAFLSALFSRRLRYGFSGIETAHVSTAFRRVKCRSANCDATFAIACGITITVGQASNMMDLIKTIQECELTEPLQAGLSRNRDQLASYQGHTAPACPVCHVGYGMLSGGRREPDFRLRTSIALGREKLATILAAEISALGWWMDLPDNLPATMNKLGYDFRYRSSPPTAVST